MKVAKRAAEKDNREKKGKETEKEQLIWDRARGGKMTSA